MIKLRLVVVFIIIGIITGGTLISPTLAQDTQHSFEAAPCVVPVGDLLEGEDITCGYVTVPEFHDRDTGNTNRLAVALVHSTSDNPADDPVIMGMGGPGGSGLDSILPLVLGTNGQALLAQRDVIVFEQRGVKYTDPHLTCPEVRAVEHDYIGQDIPTEVELAAFVACRDRLTAEGVDFSAFNSVQSAADIPFIVDALGYTGDYNYYGVSYGTLLGQHLVRDHAAGLRSVIFDGVIPIEGYFTSRHAIPADRMFRHVFASCANDAACNDAFPNLETVFLETADALNTDPAILSVESEAGTVYDLPMDGDAFVYSLVILSYEAEAVPYLPQWIYDIANGDYTLPLLLAQALVFGEESQAPGMRDAIICSEEGLLIPNDVVDESALIPQVASALGGDGGLADRCAIWDVDVLGEFANEPVVSDIPVLLISGEFDPVTPRSHADTVAAYLANHYSYTIPGASHGNFLNEDCTDTITLQFLADPTQEPDASCLDDIQFEFVTPPAGVDQAITEFELVPVVIEALGVSTVAPDSWEEISEGTYAAGETILLFMVSPGDDAVSVVIEFAANEGLNEPLQLDGLDTNGYSWSIFAILQDEQTIIVAATAYEGEVYLAILSGSEADVGVLGETLLLPAIETFVIED